MASLLGHIHQIIDTLILNGDRSVAYTALVQFQEQSANDSSAIQTLAQQSPRLLPRICSDIRDADEQIAAQSLKCLGFMIYHPSLVAAISEIDAYMVVESLVKLITTTKMKGVCNLGVWCISIQQFNASLLASHIGSLLSTIVHALDNPFGSLSTTFEAIQAVMKLATQLSEQMREMSNIWAPPIYRRLLSFDKRERDMSERCLLKVNSIALPPPLTLSKAVAVDIRKRLLPRMKDMIQDHGKKVYTIQAWGWYIRLLGSNAMKNRHLVNDMLKIPEKAFSDPDPQVQIASQVAWEGLVDALVQPSVLARQTNISLGHGTQQNLPVPSGASTENCQNQVNGLSKSIKLIMTPLLGVMSSKCDISVHSCCLNTWHYLLHKLGLSVNFSSVVKTVLEPMLAVIFNMGPDIKSIWLWNSCVDLLEDFASSKFKKGDSDMNGQLISCNRPPQTTSLGIPMGDKRSLQDYPIKWLPWDHTMLDFHLKMIDMIINQGLMITTPENRNLALDTALRIFRSVLKGVQDEFKILSNNYSEILSCLNKILSFTKAACEDVISKLSAVSTSDLCSALQFLEAVREELEPSILASPLYRVSLDLKYIKDLQSANGIQHLKIPGIGHITYMDMVSPMIYLTILYLCMAGQSISSLPETETVIRAMQKYVKSIFSMNNPLENLHAIICLLHMHRHKVIYGEFCWMEMWKVIVKGLKDHIDEGKDLAFLKVESDATGYLVVYWFLCYPFVTCYSQDELFTSVKTSSCSELCLISLQRELDLELVIETWKSLYDSANCASHCECSTMNSFAEGLCKILTGVLDESVSMLEGSEDSCSKERDQSFFFFCVYGEVAIHVLTEIRVSNDAPVRSRARKIQEDSHKHGTEGSSIKNSLEFVAKVLRLSLTTVKNSPQVKLPVISKVFAAMARFVHRLCSIQDILLLMETISDPLVQWLSSYPLPSGEMKEGNNVCHLQLLWTHTLDCLQRIQPPITFDSFFLGFQAPLLQTALDHPHAPISEATIAFWKSTYGKQVTLRYPQCLLQVLDKLSREGRINLPRGSPPFLVDTIVAPKRYKVTATQKRISKRVEIMKDSGIDTDCVDVAPLGLKKKWLHLTEHQREVRRAQQGKERDCNGHGPGVRTYTSADFSQGNDEESQESQELRNPESILEMLRRAR